MITPKGQAKVLDFGLAKLLAGAADATQSVPETRGLMGTPLYMSPEQALGKAGCADGFVEPGGGVLRDADGAAAVPGRRADLGCCRRSRRMRRRRCGDCGRRRRRRRSRSWRGRWKRIRRSATGRRQKWRGIFCAAGEDERSDSGGGGDAVDAQAANGGRGAGADHGGGSSGGVVALSSGWRSGGGRGRKRFRRLRR